MSHDMGFLVGLAFGLAAKIGYNKVMKTGLQYKAIVAILIFVSIFGVFTQHIFATDLASLTTESSAVTPLSAVNHTVTFSVTTAENLKQIDFQWGKSSSDTTKPSSLSLTNTTLGTTTGLTDGAWAFDSSSKADGLLRLKALGGGQTFAANDTVSVIFDSVTNPDVGDCSISGMMYDECYMHVVTYSDFGTTWVDNGISFYRIEYTPSLEFTISGVSSGSTHNGVTTSVASDYDTINFGHLAANTAKYAAHKLDVATTAVGGYTVKMKMDGYMQGTNNVNNKMDPFAAINASWSNPVAWDDPFGNEANTDTGWVGANTSDTRVPDWSSASGKFGPVSTTAHTVMQSTTRDSGSAAYVSYAVEINDLQPPDVYQGVILYSIVPTY